MNDIGIFGAKILSMDKNFSIINDGAIIIDKGKIVEIGDSEKLRINFPVLKSIEAKGKLVMPGLINTHTHSAMTIFRGFADDIALKSWLHEFVFPSEAKYINAETVKLGTTLAIVEMLLSGTTTYNDMYFYVQEAAEVTEKFGMRAVLSEGIIDYPTPSAASPEIGIIHTEELLQNWKNNTLINIAISAHSPYSCSKNLLQKVKSFADKHAIKLHIHLAETQWEVVEIQKLHKLTPTEYLESIGILDSNVIAAHSVHLTEHDIDLYAKYGLGVAHNPECNMKLASGVAPIPKLLAKGVKVGIGTDGVASNNNLDIFQDLRTAAFVHKLVNSNPSLANAKEMVKMATIGGAQVLGLEHEIGSLEKGKKADLLIVDLFKPHLMPIYDIYSHIVFSMTGNDVETSIINGKIVMENRFIKGLDFANLSSQVQEIANKIIKDSSPDRYNF